jgi:maltose alpha-D-glucosyltransferase/alpha-amylase
MERLIRRRRETPELGWGTWSLPAQEDAAVFALQADWDRSTVIALHNLAGRPARARVEVDGDCSLVDLFDEEELNAGALTGGLELPPYASRWFRVRLPGQRLAP